MDSNVLLLTQCFINIIAWFLPSFGVMLAVTWAVSFFRR